MTESLLCEHGDGAEIKESVFSDTWIDTRNVGITDSVVSWVTKPNPNVDVTHCTSALVQ